MKYRRLINLLILGVLIAFLVGTVIYSRNQNTSVRVGSPTPDFILPTNNLGDSIHLSQFRGQVVFLNFWASWCDPCREETPALQTFYERYGDQLAQVGINWREPWPVIAEYKKLFGFSYPIARDADGTLARNFGMLAVPESWFLDENGVARSHHIGAMSFEQMQQAYREVTGERKDEMPDDPLNDLTATPDGTIWLATPDGLFRMKGANTWLAERLNNESIGALRVGSFGANIWVLDMRGRLWLSEAGKWDRVEDLPIESPQAAVWYDSNIWLWGDGQGLWFSPNQGTDWSKRGAGLPEEVKIYDLEVLQSGRKKTLLAATSNGLWRSDDDGRRWSPMNVHAQNYDPQKKIPWDERFKRPIYRIALDPSDLQAIYLATEIGLWRSLDGGQTFHWPPKSPFRKLTGVAVTADGRVILAAPDGDLYKEQNEDDWLLWHKRRK